MRIKAFSTLALGVGLGLVGSQLAACSNSADDCNATASCGNAGGSTMAGSAGKAGGGAGNEGGGSGAGAGSNSGGSQGTSGNGGNAGEGGGSGSGCEGDVADDAACWTTNELGVFVSSDTGDDAVGNGTKEAPFASISKAIGAAAGKNVYVCLGMEDAYEEKVMLSDAVGDGVKIYGGFECTNWTHDVARYVTVESPENIALRIQDLAQGVQIENVRFFAADGAGDNHSSYGAFVTNSVGVVLRRVEITAGDGLKGADGEPGVKGENGSVAGTAPVGSDACAVEVAAGSWTVESTCGSQGGAGGAGKKNTANGNPGGAGSPTEHVTGEINNEGPGETTLITDLNGKAGADGNGGDVGLAAPTSGTFSVTGFAPAAGNAGTPGHTGQGGGGGGASIGATACFGASGGAGGMGGCGGAAGKGGQGGGASVGLLAWSSEITLDACAIASGTGGSGGGGGKGGASGAGAEGGPGGEPFDDGNTVIARGGRGGTGGKGGVGGSGSGGTGGPSVALTFSGTKPLYDATTILTPGDGGTAGIGATAGTTAPDGSEGDSQAEFEIP